MSIEGALLAGALAGLLGILVPRLIAATPEPDEADDDKEPYADIAATRWLWWLAPLISAGIGALIGGAIGVEWPLLFLVPLVPVGVALALIDWRTRLLPTRIIAPTYLVLIPLVIIAALASDDPRILVRAAIGWALLGGAYLLVWIIYPGGMGYGDVRLSGILGIVLGYLGFGQLALGGWSAFLLGGIGGLFLIALKVIDRKHNPFGPWMLIGAVLGIVLGPSFAQWMWGDLAP